MRIEQCPVKTAIDVIGGKWKPLILFELKSGPRRFGELHRAVPAVSQKVITEQLRELEADGIVGRVAHLGRMKQTEYSLTDYGETLRPILALLAEWGSSHRERTESSAANQPQRIAQE